MVAPNFSKWIYMNLFSRPFAPTSNPVFNVWRKKKHLKLFNSFTATYLIQNFHIYVYYLKLTNVPPNLSYIGRDSPAA